MDVSSVFQNIVIIGDSNTVTASGRDIHGAPPPPPPDRAQPFLIRPPHRKFGIVGVLALAAALVIGALELPRSIFPPLVWPDGKTALCNDGWYSASLHRSGTCSTHHGVAYWRSPADDVLSRR